MRRRETGREGVRRRVRAHLGAREAWQRAQLVLSDEPEGVPALTLPRGTNSVLLEHRVVDASLRGGGGR